MTDQTDKSKWIGGDDQDKYYEQGGVQEAIATAPKDGGEHPEGPADRTAEEPVLMERGPHQDFAGFEDLLEDEKPYDPAQEAIDGIDPEGIVEKAFAKPSDGGTEELKYCGLINQVFETLKLFRKNPADHGLYFKLTGAKSELSSLERIFELRGPEYQRETMARIDSQLKQAGMDRQTVVEELHETIRKEVEKASRENAMRRQKEEIEKKKAASIPAVDPQKGRSLLDRILGRRR